MEFCNYGQKESAKKNPGIDVPTIPSVRSIELKDGFLTSFLKKNMYGPISLFLRELEV